MSATHAGALGAILDVVPPTRGADVWTGLGKTTLAVISRDGDGDDGTNACAAHAEDGGPCH